MRYAFIDPANHLGCCIVDESELIQTFVVRKIGDKGNWLVGKSKYPSKFEAFASIIERVDHVVCEEGFGRFSTAIKSQAGYREYIHAVCDYHTHIENKPRTFRTVNVSEWRRVIKEAYGVSFPANSKGCKELSVKLVKQHFGLDVTDDESDAVLLFVACKRMGMVEQ